MDEIFLSHVREGVCERGEGGGFRLESPAINVCFSHKLSAGPRGCGSTTPLHFLVKFLSYFHK